MTSCPFSPTDRDRDPRPSDRCVGQPIPGPESLHIRGPRRGRSYDRHGLRTRRPKDLGVHPSHQSEAGHRGGGGP